MRRVTSWLHVWFGIRQEGVNPCRMVPSMRDEVHVQQHNVTGKVQRARLRIAVQKHDVRVAALDAHVNLEKNELIWKQKQASHSGEQDSRGRGEKPPVLGTGLPLVRGMG